MNAKTTVTSVSSLVRFGVPAALVALLPSLMVAKAPNADTAAGHLARSGSIPVQSAGPYVERGTFRIQVSTKLGRPDVVVDENTWLYSDREIDGSQARGTLIVRFNQGRVVDLKLATATVVAALRANAPKAASGPYLATK